MGQPLLRRVGQAFVVNVRQTVGLGAGGRDDIAPPMAEGGGHGAAAHRIEVAPPAGVLHPDAFALDQHRVPAIELQREDAGRPADDHGLRRFDHALLPSLASAPNTGPG